jgi:hypothetical protein
VPQLCELIENVKICPSPYFYCWLVVVIFFCFAWICTTVCLKHFFFYAFKLLEMLLWGHVKKPAKNALLKVALPRGFVSLRAITDPGIWALVNRTNYLRGK